MIISVLGMHRSGTSCLMGILRRAGVSLIKGNKYLKLHESQQFVELHNKYLKLSDGNWFNPPADIIHQTEFIEEAKNIISQHETKICGFKDPRTLLFVDLWQHVAPIQFIGIYRHPMSVVKSLQKRELEARSRNVSIQKGLDLWMHYNQKMLNAHANCSFPLLSFDDPDFIEKVKNFLTTLDLNPEGLLAFDPDKKHHEDTMVDGKCESLYAQLKSISQ